MTQPTKPHPGHPFVARIIDGAMWPLRRLRRKVVSQAEGTVLEVGVGTGLNFPCYGEIEALHGVEPDPYMLERANRRGQDLPYPIDLIAVGGESMPYEDQTFDTVVATWVLCTIPEPEKALAEMYRVLKPGGRLLYVEHTRSKNRVASVIQNGLNPLWKAMAGGCHLNRDSVSMIHQAGFSDVTVKPSGGENWTIFPMYRGVAIK